MLEIEWIGKTMADKFKYIPKMLHKITFFVDYNYWLKRLDTQLNEQINQNSIKISNVLKLTNKKTAI